ncbi:hypothetical protein NDU88_009676 [Pleurodeles waltl]|uniref:Uncharacterized protein n=1 Tax=Pleurodeles waltl TaxID=8319 RepID=A0AAV7RY95_PLEWA|nr:hypothetical protein NDU88_009676 [Pleurodeles waltl]
MRTQSKVDSRQTPVQPSRQGLHWGSLASGKQWASPPPWERGSRPLARTDWRRDPPPRAALGTPRIRMRTAGTGGTIGAGSPSPPGTAGKPLAPPVQAGGPSSCKSPPRREQLLEEAGPSTPPHSPPLTAVTTRRAGLPNSGTKRLWSDPTADRASREGAHHSLYFPLPSPLIPRSSFTKRSPAAHPVGEEVARGDAPTCATVQPARPVLAGGNSAPYSLGNPDPRPGRHTPISGMHPRRIIHKIATQAGKMK